MRHPPPPWKSTQKIDRQPWASTQGRREMLHSPALQVSCAQSESTRQVQKPRSSPSSMEHFPAQKPLDMPGSFAQVPPCAHSSSVAQGSAVLIGHAGFERAHPSRVETTMTS
jgi:hypothetical protein